MPRVTLCMIVRDEEAMLPACLESVEGVVDAVVVVDTGSSDRSAAIAEEAGATVVHHAWNDDFAAARNAALELVADGYVLLLDADERLAPGSGKVLRDFVRKGSADGAMLQLHNARRLDATLEEVLDGSARLGEPMHLTRLFRRTPDFRWEGLVHEHVTSWAQGRSMQAIQASIVHYGAVPELREQLDKGNRNLRLLERVCEQQPDNVVYLTYLTQDLLEAGQYERARETADRAWSLLERTHEQEGLAPYSVPLASICAFMALCDDDLDGAFAILQQSRAWSGDHPSLDLLQCVHAERSLLEDDLEAGEALARSALKAGRRALSQADRVFKTPCLPGATSWATGTRLGLLHLLLGEPELALAELERVCADHPGNREAMLGRAEALILTGRAAEVIADGEALIGSDTPDGWILAAVATLQLGADDDLMPMLAQAQSALATKRLVAPHRRYFLEELWIQVTPTRASA